MAGLVVGRPDCGNWIVELLCVGSKGTLVAVVSAWLRFVSAWARWCLALVVEVLAVSAVQFHLFLLLMEN